MLRVLDRYGFARDEIFAIRMAVEEGLANAIIHGNRSNPTALVHILFCINPKTFTISIGDEGKGFDPDAVSASADGEHPKQPHQSGLMLMRRFMHAVRFNATGNAVTLERRRSSPSSQAGDLSGSSCRNR
ncbi:MAG: ATP-binding protein [Planctomycetes bacterium]|nr:ATP-binding protein [Planctomycetota bacterium]